MDFLGLTITGALLAVFFTNVLFAYSAYAALLSGSFNLAFPAFIAIGSYSSAILTVNHHVSPVVAALAGAAVSVAVGVGLLFLLRKLGGVFLAIATINVLFLVQVVATNWTSVTGGSTGISGLPPSIDTNDLLIAVVVVAAGFFLFSRSLWGAGVVIRREDPVLAESLGFSARQSAIWLVAASAVVASLAGSMQAHYLGFVEPSNYGLSLVVQLIAMVVLGGVGSWAGPIIGAAFFTFVPEWASGLGSWRDVLTAVVLLIVVRYAPDGIAGVVTRVIDSRKMRRSRASTFGERPAPLNSPATVGVFENVGPASTEEGH